MERCAAEEYFNRSVSGSSFIGPAPLHLTSQGFPTKQHSQHSKLGSDTKILGQAAFPQVEPVN
jgi:hypothetical protein